MGRVKKYPPMQKREVGRADRDKRRIPCEVYSRVVGYLRPVSDWNFAKRQEFADRVPYKVG
jgi:anaerobic ribonucleoside-triphosphate reductase